MNAYTREIPSRERFQAGLQLTRHPGTVFDFTPIILEWLIHYIALQRRTLLFPLQSRLSFVGLPALSH